MVYATGTITNGGGVALRDQIESMLSTHASWSFIKTVTVSTETYKVWSNLGNTWTNSRPFYVIFSTSSSTATTLNIIISEGFNTTDNTVTGYSGSTISVTLNSDGVRAATSLSSAFGNPLYINNLPVTAASYTYWIAVTSEGIFIRTSVSSNNGYVGSFDPILQSFMGTNVEFPLIVFGTTLSTNGNSYSSFARLPGRTGSQTSYSLSIKVNSLNVIIGVIPTGISWLGNKSTLSKILVSSGKTNNEVRGILPSWLLTSLLPDAAVVVNDTITINGVVHRYMGSMGSNGTYVWLSEAA